MPEFYHREIGWPAFRDSVAKIRKLAGDRPTFLLVDYGHFDLESGKPVPENQEAIRIARDAGLGIVDPWVDFVTFLERWDLPHSGPLDVSRVDAHPNGLRHELLARALLRAMRPVLPPDDVRLITETYFGGL